MGILITFILLIILSGCQGKGGGSTSFFNTTSDNGSNTIKADVVETQKLSQAIQSTPEYKIDNSEIDTLKSNGLLTDQEELELKKIQ